MQLLKAFIKKNLEPANSSFLSRLDDKTIDQLAVALGPQASTESIEELATGILKEPDFRAFEAASKIIFDYAPHLTPQWATTFSLKADAHLSPLWDAITLSKNPESLTTMITALEPKILGYVAYPILKSQVCSETIALLMFKTMKKHKMLADLHRSFPYFVHAITLEDVRLIAKHLDSHDIDTTLRNRRDIDAEKLQTIFYQWTRVWNSDKDEWNLWLKQQNITQELVADLYSRAKDLDTKNRPYTSSSDILDFFSCPQTSTEIAADIYMHLKDEEAIKNANRHIKANQNLSLPSLKMIRKNYILMKE